MKNVTLVLMLKSEYQNLGTEAKEKLQGEFKHFNLYTRKEGSLRISELSVPVKKI